MPIGIHGFLKDLRWSLYQDLEAQVHDLRYLFWESTRRCNLTCRHCGSDCGRDDDQEGLDGETVRRVFGSIASKYKPQNIMLVVTGGEPTMRPDLIEILQYAGSLGFRLGMVTNGIALDGKMARRLADAGMESVVVSLDGPKVCHDWLRARKNAFERACRAIAFMRGEGIPTVEGITCVTPRSLKRLTETYEIALRAGCTHWRVFNIFPIGRAKDDYELLLSEDMIRTLVEEMARLRERGKKEGMVVNLSEEGYLGWDWEKKVRDTPYFCRAGINIAGILADGSIAACPNLPPWMNQGNVAKDDFEDVWENRYEMFRDRTWTKQGPCKDCSAWRVCRGNSLHLWNPEESRPHWCHYKIMKS